MSCCCSKVFNYSKSVSIVGKTAYLNSVRKTSYILVYIYTINTHQKYARSNTASNNEQEELFISNDLFDLTQETLLHMIKIEKDHFYLNTILNKSMTIKVV